MVIRFNKETINNFNIENFSTLVGKVGLYLIYLNDLLIPYPLRCSRLIYIGMSESRINSIGNRLRDHLAGRSRNRGITGYKQNWQLSFTYLEYEFLKHIFTEEKIEYIETYFLEDFANKHGAYPICNNKRGLEEIPKIINTPKIDWNFFGEVK